MTESDSPVQTLLVPRWIIPVEPAGTVLDAHAVLVRDGRIAAIAPENELTDQLTAAGTSAAAIERIELRDHALLPGLINAHGHAPMALLRGAANDMPLMQWLQEHIWPLEQALVDAGFVREGTQLACAEMLLGGTTCFNDMYFFPDQVADAAASLGMKCCVGLIVIEFPSPWAGSADEYFSKGQAVHDQFRHNPLVYTAFAPHAPYTVSDASFRKVAMLAEELDLPVHTHLHETADEVEGSVTEHGMRPIARLEQLGVISERLLAVHMTQLANDEIELVGRRGVSVLHCPESNMHLASGTCPVPRLLDAGINVALGTDSAASNNDLDMLQEMRSAALLAKHMQQDAAALTAEQALAMATINGARALGIDDDTGSITVGKSADLVAIDLSSPRTQPTVHPINQVVYAASAAQVSDVWINGKRRVVNGRLATSLDLATVAERWRLRVLEVDGGTPT